MPRNQSEKGPFPTRFPFPDAPSPELPPRFHERSFLLMSINHSESELGREGMRRFHRLKDSFSDEEMRQYEATRPALRRVREFYDQWWETHAPQSQ